MKQLIALVVGLVVLATSLLCFAPRQVSSLQLSSIRTDGSTVQPHVTSADRCYFVEMTVRLPEDFVFVAVK